MFHILFYLWQRVFSLKLIFWEKVNLYVKYSKIVIFEPKCHKNGDFKVKIFFAFFASFSLQRIFFAKIFFVCKESLLGLQYNAHSYFLTNNYINVKQIENCFQIDPMRQINCLKLKHIQKCGNVITFCTNYSGSSNSIQVCPKKSSRYSKPHCLRLLFISKWPKWVQKSCYFEEFYNKIVLFEDFFSFFA